jgi:hypothetical protein
MSRCKVPPINYSLGITQEASTSLKLLSNNKYFESNTGTKLENLMVAKTLYRKVIIYLLVGSWEKYI